MDKLANALRSMTIMLARKCVLSAGELRKIREVKGKNLVQ